MLIKVSTFFIFSTCLWLCAAPAKSMDEIRHSIHDKNYNGIVRSERSAFKLVREVNTSSNLQSGNNNWSFDQFQALPDLQKKPNQTIKSYAQSSNINQRDLAAKVTCQQMQENDDDAKSALYVFAESQNVYERDTAGLVIYKGMREGANWAQSILNDFGKSYSANERDTAARSLNNGLHTEDVWAYNIIISFANSNSKFVRDTAARVIFVGNQMKNTRALFIFNELAKSDNENVKDTVKRSQQFQYKK